jgi:hypothetical protein
VSEELTAYCLACGQNSGYTDQVGIDEWLEVYPCPGAKTIVVSDADEVELDEQTIDELSVGDWIRGDQSLGYPQEAAQITGFSILGGQGVVALVESDYENESIYLDHAFKVSAPDGGECDDCGRSDGTHDPDVEH